jgi:hypothetical protein
MGSSTTPAKRWVLKGMGFEYSALRKDNWRVVRVVYGARLESVCA